MSSNITYFQYVGMITGIIGSITGITGSILGLIGYRKSKLFKLQDLRISLKKDIIAICKLKDDVKDIMINSDNSRIAVSAASGWLNSGAMIKWKEKVKNDNNNLELISKEIPDNQNIFDKFTLPKIEAEIIRIHTYKIKIN